MNNQRAAPAVRPPQRFPNKSAIVAPTVAQRRAPARARRRPRAAAAHAWILDARGQPLSLARGGEAVQLRRSGPRPGRPSAASKPDLRWGWVGGWVGVGWGGGWRVGEVAGRKTPTSQGPPSLSPHSPSPAQAPPGPSPRPARGEACSRYCTPHAQARPVPPGPAGGTSQPAPICLRRWSWRCSPPSAQGSRRPWRRRPPPHVQASGAPGSSARARH